jgi:hypothetical protein
MMTNNSIQSDPFGFMFDEIDVDTNNPITNIPDTNHPIVGGPFGQVDKIGLYKGDSAHLTGTNDKAVGVLFLDGVSDYSTGIVAGYSEAGQGRVAFVTDSAIGGDGSDSHGKYESYKNSHW